MYSIVTRSFDQSANVLFQFWDHAPTRFRFSNFVRDWVESSLPRADSSSSLLEPVSSLLKHILTLVESTMAWLAFSWLKHVLTTFWAPVLSSHAKGTYWAASPSRTCAEERLYHHSANAVPFFSRPLCSEIIRARGEKKLQGHLSHSAQKTFRFGF